MICFILCTNIMHVEPFFFFRKIYIFYVGFKALTAVIMKREVMRVNRSFGGTYRLHLQLPACFHAGFLLGLFFDPKDGGDIFLRNVG
jgi:hypothetical protein